MDNYCCINHRLRDHCHRDAGIFTCLLAVNCAETGSVVDLYDTLATVKHCAIKPLQDIAEQLQSTQPSLSTGQQMAVIPFNCKNGPILCWPSVMYIFLCLYSP